jgi:hypothetical protein
MSSAGFGALDLLVPFGAGLPAGRFGKTGSATTAFDWAAVALAEGAGGGSGAGATSGFSTSIGGEGAGFWATASGLASLVADTARSADSLLCKSFVMRPAPAASAITAATPPARMPLRFEGGLVGAGVCVRGAPVICGGLPSDAEGVVAVNGVADRKGVTPELIRTLRLGDEPPVLSKGSDERTLKPHTSASEVASSDAD